MYPHAILLVLVCAVGQTTSDSLVDTDGSSVEGVDQTDVEDAVPPPPPAPVEQLEQATSRLLELVAAKRAEAAVAVAEDLKAEGVEVPVELAELGTDTASAPRIETAPQE